MSKVKMEEQKWDFMTCEQKNHVLFLREKELLDVLLKHGAITQAQHDKDLHDLSEKMGEEAEPYGVYPG